MNTLKDLILSLPLPKKIKMSILALEIAKKYWKKVVEPHLCQISNPLAFEEGTLLVGVSNHYALQILSSRSLEIIEKLEKKVPTTLRPLFKEIKFKYIFEEHKEKMNFYKKKLPENKIRFENIQDPELKSLFEKAFKSYLNIFKI